MRDDARVMDGMSPRDTSRSQGGRWLMSLSRIFLSCSFAAMTASGLAVAFPQERADARAQPQRNAPNAQARPTKPADPAGMETLLRKWEAQSAKLKTLDVKIYRIDARPDWLEEIHYQGTAKFQNPELAFLDFRKVQTTKNAKGQRVAVTDPQTKQRITAPHETIICSGKDVWQYLYDTKQIFVYPLDKQEQKRALDEGPLPFLFNMKAAEAKKRYEMSLIREDPKYFLVMVQPRLPEDQESFKKAWIFLDPQFLLPIRIVLLSPDNKSSKDFHLSDIRSNTAVDLRYFKGVVLGGWKLIRDANAQLGARANERIVPIRPAAPRR